MSRAYAEGRDAAYSGQPHTVCPYVQGTRDFQLWMDGFNDAMQPDDDERGCGPL